MGNNNTLYRCVVTESASCSDTTDVVTVSDVTSINELNSALVKIYPNPSDGIVHLVLTDYSAGKVVLTDMLGKEVLNKSFTSKDFQINLKSLASKGTYFTKVIDLDGNVIAIKKLIYKQRITTKYIKNRRNISKIKAFGPLQSLCLTESFILRNRLLFTY